VQAVSTLCVLAGFVASRESEAEVIEVSNPTMPGEMLSEQVERVQQHEDIVKKIESLKQIVETIENGDLPRSEEDADTGCLCCAQGAQVLSDFSQDSIDTVLAEQV
jgi:hypothetical protein